MEFTKEELMMISISFGNKNYRIDGPTEEKKDLVYGILRKVHNTINDLEKKEQEEFENNKKNSENNKKNSEYNKKNSEYNKFKEFMDRYENEKVL